MKIIFIGDIVGKNARDVVIKKIPDLRITISLRVIDKSLEQIANVTQASIEANLDGVLVLMGDPSQNSNHNSGIFPSQAVQHLNNLEYNKKTDIFLSLPSNPCFESCVIIVCIFRCSSLGGPIGTPTNLVIT